MWRRLKKGSLRCYCRQLNNGSLKDRSLYDVLSLSVLPSFKQQQCRCLNKLALYASNSTLTLKCSKDRLKKLQKTEKNKKSSKKGNPNVFKLSWRICYLIFKDPCDKMSFWHAKKIYFSIITVQLKNQS